MRMCFYFGCFIESALEIASEHDVVMRQKKKAANKCVVNVNVLRVYICFIPSVCTH